MNVIDFSRVINECKSVCCRDIKLDIWSKFGGICIRVSWFNDVDGCFDYDEPDNSIEMGDCDITDRIIAHFKSKYVDMWGERD